jgi:ubiquinone/menaquinone biosynthesis C-methylase UbiE
MTPHPDWPSFLDEYHRTNPAITEQLLQRCTDDPYGWLMAAVPSPTGVMLDLACGSAPLFGRRESSGYVGVDFSVAELSVAARRGVGPLVRGDAGRLPLADASIDVAVCSMALQVLTPLPTVLSEMARVLRPGGRLVALIPVSAPLTVTDRLRYGQVLLRLRRWRLGYANPGVPRTLRRSGWTIESQQARRFAYPIQTPADGRRLVQSLYLPGSSTARQQTTAEQVSRWLGAELGIPLLRLVARPPALEADRQAVFS